MQNIDFNPCWQVLHAHFADEGSNFSFLSGLNNLDKKAPEIAPQVYDRIIESLISLKKLNKNIQGPFIRKTKDIGYRTRARQTFEFDL